MSLLLMLFHMTIKYSLLNTLLKAVVNNKPAINYYQTDWGRIVDCMQFIVRVIFRCFRKLQPLVPQIGHFRAKVRMWQMQVELLVCVPELL